MTSINGTLRSETNLSFSQNVTSVLVLFFYAHGVPIAILYANSPSITQSLSHMHSFICSPTHFWIKYQWTNHLRTLPIDIFLSTQHFSGFDFVSSFVCCVFKMILFMLHFGPKHFEAPVIKIRFEVEKMKQSFKTTNFFCYKKPADAIFLFISSIKSHP